jgi:hypothetical protein
MASRRHSSPAIKAVVDNIENPGALTEYVARKVSVLTERVRAADPPRPWPVPHPHSGGRDRELSNAQAEEDVRGRLLAHAGACTRDTARRRRGGKPDDAKPSPAPRTHTQCGRCCAGESNR